MKGFKSMLKKITTILVMLFSLTVVMACDLGDLLLIAQFTRINDLAAGDRIIYREGYIGDVERITRNAQGYYLVELDIDAAHKNQLTVYSIFYIDHDPARPGRKAVFTEQKKPGGILLTNNSVVAGAEAPPYLRKILNGLQRQAEELAGGLAAKINQANDSYQEKSTALVQRLESSMVEIEVKLRDLEEMIRTAPDSDEARELQRNLARLIADLKTALGEGETRN
jgi:ABC-type transporter Mla subunit MlaD